MRHLSGTGASRSDFRLIQPESYRAATALIRPPLEANTAAFWLTYVADYSYARALPTSKIAGRTADISQLDHMAACLVPVFPPIQTIVEELKNSGPRRLATQIHA